MIDDSIAIFSPHLSYWKNTRDILIEASGNLQVPEDMALSFMLPSLSTVIGMLIDVEIQEGWILPCTTYSWCVAKSGSGKTKTFDYFTEVIYDFEDEQKSNKDNKQPMELTMENFTAAALRNVLSASRCAIGILSSEASILINHEFISTQGDMNSLYSGSSVKSSRACSNSSNIRDSRLTIGIALQDDDMNDLLSNKKMDIRKSGFAARFLFSIPKTNIGKRFINNEKQSWEKKAAYINRMKEILNEALMLYNNPSIPRKVLRMNSEAKELWIKMHNQIEAEMAPNGSLVECTDHGSKLSEMIVRVAALFHYFEGLDGDISAESIRYAYRICMYYSECFRELFIKPPQEVIDAKALKNYLTVTYLNVGIYRAFLDDFREHVTPFRLRKKTNLQGALMELERSGWATRGGNGRPGNPQYVDINSNYTIGQYNRDFVQSC